MEIEDARDGLSALHAGVTVGSLVKNALEEVSKTKLLYQHHRERFHMSAHSNPAIQSATASEDRPVIPIVDQLMHAMPFWPDDLSGLSQQAVLNYMVENRAWNKRLREGTVALVNTRLANTITQEEYASNRERANQDVAECFRRARMLVRDLAIRERGINSFIDSSELLN
jgi:hypothetical protein